MKKEAGLLFSLWLGAILLNGLWIVGAHVCNCWNNGGSRNLQRPYFEGE
jgi:hypothetical protein